MSSLFPLPPGVWRDWLTQVGRLLIGLLVALSFLWPLLVWLLPRLAPPPPPLCWWAAPAADPSVQELEGWNADLLPSCQESPRPPARRAPAQTSDVSETAASAAASASDGTNRPAPP